MDLRINNDMDVFVMLARKGSVMEDYLYKEILKCNRATYLKYKKNYSHLPYDSFVKLCDFFGISFENFEKIKKENERIRAKLRVILYKRN